MALVSRPVDVPVPCSSPARIGSTGTIHYLLQKERPMMEQQACANRGSTGASAPKSSKEFVQVCREVVSVSCGQPLLSYKPKRTKSSKVVKPSESKVVSSKNAAESSGRSVPSRAVANVIRSAGVSEVVPATELRRGDSLHKTSLTRARGVELPVARKPLSREDGSELEFEKKPPPPCYLEHEEDAQRGEYPVFQMSNSLVSSKPLTDDYHKALIPFLRAECEASLKILKKRQCNQVPKKGAHQRSTSLGSISTFGGPTTDQKAWQSYTRDSYPPFSASKKHSFFRLASGENL